LTADGFILLKASREYIFQEKIGGISPNLYKRAEPCRVDIINLMRILAHVYGDGLCAARAARTRHDRRRGEKEMVCEFNMY
jgi:hypothetical protein